MKSTIFHVAKIAPISIGETLRRDRLFTQLNPDPPTKAFWISGPGGSGKTTLVADFLETNKIPCLWYQVDSFDGDPATFFYYFGKAAHPLLVEEHSPPLLTREYLPQIEIFILHYFENLFQRLRPGSWLVFDNFQDAPKGSPLPSIILAALKQLPDHISIAILSRNEPPQSMSRLLANRIMRHLGWSQLAFTREEFAAFLDFSGSRIDPAEITRLHTLTKGWIAGVILWLIHYTDERILETVPAEWTPENIFDYFASEILEKSSAEIKEFLLQTAFLPNMTVEMAAELTGMPAADILESLHRRNFFVEKHRGRLVSYQYHPLFRRFLSRQAIRFFDKEGLKSIRQRAAQILEAHNMKEEAFRLYLETEAFMPMKHLILAEAQALVDQGRYTVLSSWIDALPPDLKEEQPWMLLWKSIATVPFDPKDSVSLATMAYQKFTESGDIDGQVLSWSTVVDILTMLRTGFSKLDSWIVEGERLGHLLVDNEGTIGLNSRFAAAMLMALLLRNQGHPEMEKWQSHCEKLYFRRRDDQIGVALIKNLFWSYYWLGQLNKAQEMVAELKFLRYLETLPPFGKIILGALLALAGIMRGDHAECSRLVHESLELAEKTGIRVFDFLIMSFLTYSSLGQSDLKTVRPLMEKLKDSLSNYAIWDKGKYHYLHAWFSMQAGNLSHAEEHLKQATSLLKACGNPLTTALCRILRSQLLLDIGLPAKAERVLPSRPADSRLGHNRMLPFLMALAQADCAYAQKREEEARFFCAQAFGAARKEGLWIPFGLSHRRLGSLCKFALESEIEVDTVTAMIRRWNLQPAARERAWGNLPWPIRIVVLGRFTIHCQDRAITLSIKGPKKPLELLSLLIFSGRNGILREAAADKLWPDSDGDRAIRALNTTVYRLRRLLGNDEAVTYQGGHLMLNRELCWVDSWRFLSLAQHLQKILKTDKSEEYITEALRLYQGELAIGYGLGVAVRYSKQLYDHWLDMLAAALPASAAAGFDDEAGKSLRMALSVDETAVEVLQKTVKFYQKEDIAKVDTILQNCRKLLFAKNLAQAPKTRKFLDGIFHT